ncbi:MAG: hypothetical protein WEA08_00445, partial [Woeseia sp.]
MRVLIALLTVLLLDGCGSQEVLESRPAANASGTSFAGIWQRREKAGDVARQLNRAIRETAGMPNRVIVPLDNERRRPQRSKGGLAHVFLRDGDNLKITQTPYGIFISFDRSVVEEYRFGENRIITLGQVEAQRVSGWDGDDYVVETLGRNGMKVSERFSLSGDGSILTREIVFRSRNKQEVVV